MVTLNAFQRQVVDLLRARGPMSTTEVVEALSGTHGPTVRSLTGLKDRGVIDYVGFPSKWVYVERLPSEVGPPDAGPLEAPAGRGSVKPLKCRFCDRAFSREAFRLSHERAKHPMQIVSVPEAAAHAGGISGVIAGGEPPTDRERLRDWLSQVERAAGTMRRLLGD